MQRVPKHNRKLNATNMCLISKSLTGQYIHPHIRDAHFIWRQQRFVDIETGNTLNLDLQLYKEACHLKARRLKERADAESGDGTLS